MTTTTDNNNNKDIIPPCVKCGAEATMVSPDDYCNKCWAEWWTDGLLEGTNPTPEQREEVLMETMEVFMDDNDIKDSS